MMFSFILSYNEIFLRKPSLQKGKPLNVWVILAAFNVCSMAFNGPTHPMIPHFSALSLRQLRSPLPQPITPLHQELKLEILKIEWKIFHWRKKKHLKSEIAGIVCQYTIYILKHENEEPQYDWCSYSFHLRFHLWNGDLKQIGLKSNIVISKPSSWTTLYLGIHLTQTKSQKVKWTFLTKQLML